MIDPLVSEELVVSFPKTLCSHTFIFSRLRGKLNIKCTGCAYCSPLRRITNKWTSKVVCGSASCEAVLWSKRIVACSDEISVMIHLHVPTYCWPFGVSARGLRQRWRHSESRVTAIVVRVCAAVRRRVTRERNKCVRPWKGMWEFGDTKRNIIFVRVWTTSVRFTFTLADARSELLRDISCARVMYMLWCVKLSTKWNCQVWPRRVRVYTSCLFFCFLRLRCCLWTT